MNVLKEYMAERVRPLLERIVGSIRRHPAISSTAVAFMVLLTLLGIWSSFRSSRQDMKRSVVLIERRSAYALVCNRDTLCTFADSTHYLAGCWLNSVPVIPSCHGRIITAPQRIPGTVVGRRPEADSIRTRLGEEKHRLEGENGELTYYLGRHSVQDEGFDMIAQRQTAVERALDSVASLLAQFEKAAHSDSLCIVYTASYRVYYDNGKRQRAHKECRLLPSKRQRYALLQTTDHKTPRGVKAQDRYGMPWGTLSHGRIYTATFPGAALLQEAVCRSQAIVVGGQAREKLQHNFPQMLCADGSPVFSGAGRFIGITQGHQVITLRTVLKTFQPTVIKNRFRYSGEMKNGKFHGWGELTKGDSIVYSGQWTAGQRNGRGRCCDPKGRNIDGRWAADTLVSGKRRDGNTRYEGEMDRNGNANGYGRCTTDDGSYYYEGHWTDDRENVFGYAINSEPSLKVGEWKNGKYLGERLTYTSDRIYGIDISKYQHEIGRRKYAIQWDKLRITSLGKLSKKRVRGTVDYPVSFIFIKSTEGTTVRNKYYAADYNNARKHGIVCGNYHFFSTRSSGSAQADYFIRHSHFKKGDLPPVLDVEPSAEQIRQAGGTDVLFRNIRAWMEAVERRTGVRPILYVSQNFVNQYLSEAPDIKRKYRVWIARYGEYKPDVKLFVWQLCPDGRVNGIQGDVDINVFNGYKPQFNDFLSTGLLP